MKIKLTEQQLEQILEYLNEDKDKQITCECGWSWNTNESEEDDKYICHKCGKNNE